jgi:ATP-binding cassette, subfamily C, bacteriocin exporter
MAGLTGKGFRTDPDGLTRLPNPAVLNVTSRNGHPHWIVLVRLDRRRRALVMDPETAEVAWWSWEKMSQRYRGVALVFGRDESAAAAVHTKSVRPWQRLRGLLRPHWAAVAQAFVGALASTVLALSLAFFVELLLDRVLPHGDRRLLLLLSAGMAVILAVRALLLWLEGRLGMRLAQAVDGSLVMGYIRHLLVLPQAFFGSMRVGEMLSRVGDAVKVREFLQSTLVALIMNPLIIVFALGTMMLYSWKLALLAAGMLPGFVALHWLTNRINRREQRALMVEAAELEGQMVESLQGHAVVRAAGIESHTALLLENRLVRLLRTGWRHASGLLATGTAMFLVTQGFTVALLAWGAGLALNGDITPGELMSCFTLAGYLTGPMTTLLGLNSHVQDALLATERLYELMDLERERDVGTVRFDAETGARDISFIDVTFAYPGRLPVLRNANVTIGAGEITVLQGPSGSGKSTLLALLQRQWSPTTGRIEIGGIHLDLFRLQDLRRGLGTVPQTVELFSGTILENLVPGDDHPDLERLIDVCRRTGFMDFVDRQPQGLLSPLIESGRNLSGGQRQRIAIVRALYRNCPILLFDEPTSALDANNRQCLRDLLRQLRDEGKTIVIATHEEAMGELADRVIHFDQAGEVQSREEGRRTPSLCSASARRISLWAGTRAR